jgi:hypothetical protein
MSFKATKGLTALTAEINSLQIAMGLPPVTFAVTWMSQNICDASATPSGIKKEERKKERKVYSAVHSI